MSDIPDLSDLARWDKLRASANEVCLDVCLSTGGRPQIKFSHPELKGDTDNALFATHSLEAAEAFVLGWSSKR